ncbi:MAG: ADP-ribosylglycohydrolase family protein [Deltaproteobacteria bacterium]
MTDRVEAFKGCLLGLMAADRVAAGFNGQEHVPLAYRYASVEELLAALEPGIYTAATEATWAVAASLAEFPDFDGTDMASRLLSAYTPSRTYGHATRSAMERLREGVVWEEAGMAGGGRASFGNGAATRSAPVGLVHGADADRLRWVAEEAAGITHPHALASEGAVLHAHAVALALASRGGELSAEGFLATLAAESQVREFRSRFEAAAGLVSKDLASETVVERLGNGTSALASVVTAAFCFAGHAGSFERAVGSAVRLGGNTAALASMTGSLSGAYLGLSAVPDAWQRGQCDDQGQEAVSGLSDLAVRLAQVSSED